MTDTPETPATNPAVDPTAPLPPTNPNDTFAPPPPVSPAGAPYGMPPHPIHEPHVRHASEGAIVAMVVGALLFAVLAFGVGWTARGAALRIQIARGGVMMGRQFNRGPGGGQGYGQGYGQWGQGDGSGQGYGDGQGSRRGYGHRFGRRGMMGTPNGPLPNGQLPDGSQTPSASPGATTQ